MNDNTYNGRTNAAHTPGPWAATARTGEGLTPATYVIEDADRFPVVMAWRVEDARLIAAAPELLEVLWQCLIRGYMWDNDPNLYNAASKAICKAKGE